MRVRHVVMAADGRRWWPPTETIRNHHEHRLLLGPSEGPWKGPTGPREVEEVEEGGEREEGKDVRVALLVIVVVNYW